jgi:hypothetical protein
VILSFLNNILEEQWEKDRCRRMFMENNGYKVVELWESEINSGGLL